MSYDLEISATKTPSWRALRDAVELADLRGVPDEPEGDAWPAHGLSLYREGRSTRSTDVEWKDGKFRVVIRALASADDCDLALRIADALARLTGAAGVRADYFGDVGLSELRHLHGADWMHEQAESGARILATLIREGRGPMEMPGPKRSCYVGPRLLAELEAAGPPNAFSDRVLSTLRRVQWDVPPSFRNAGVFVSGGGAGAGGKQRETRFAIWLPNENLVLPRVDYVALRVTEGEIVMVPFAAVPALAGTHATPLDECQLLVPALSPADWSAIVTRARPLAAPPRK